jgi:hypothetical protein
MHTNITPSSLKRAQWITDLIDALADAEMLLLMLEEGDEFAGESARLRLRIQSVRSEVDLLNRVISGEGRVVSSTWPNLGATSAAKAEAPAR